MALHPNIRGNKLRDLVRQEIGETLGAAEVVCAVDDFYPQKIHCTNVDDARNEVTFQILFGGGLMVTRSGIFTASEYDNQIQSAKNSIQQISREKQAHLGAGYKKTRRLVRGARSLRKRRV